MSTPNATTFRFSEETRDELDRIKEELGTSTLQKTVEILIQRYLSDQADYHNLLRRFNEVERQRAAENQILSRIKEAFKLLCQEGGEHG
jgi:predicted DNA-binding protein